LIPKAVDGGTPVSVYNCLPHGIEFDKPVLLELPYRNLLLDQYSRYLILFSYDKSIPVEQLAVFHMKTDPDGKPCGTWTMMEAQFNGTTAVILTTHFSYYGILQKFLLFVFLALICCPSGIFIQQHKFAE
jgi:hypothetical protein